MHHIVPSRYFSFFSLLGDISIYNWNIILKFVIITITFISRTISFITTTHCRLFYFPNYLLNRLPGTFLGFSFRSITSNSIAGTRLRWLITSIYCLNTWRLFLLLFSLFFNLCKFFLFSFSLSRSTLRAAFSYSSFSSSYFFWNFAIWSGPVITLAVNVTLGFFSVFLVLEDRKYWLDDMVQCWH